LISRDFARRSLRIHASGILISGVAIWTPVPIAVCRPAIHRTRTLPGGWPMAPLEQLFGSEIGFHRRLRAEAPVTADASALHTGHALQCGYEPLLKRSGTVTAQDIERRSQRPSLAGDARDVLAARDSLLSIFRLWPHAQGAPPRLGKTAGPWYGEGKGGHRL
jgi:hypothetical protein